MKKLNLLNKAFFAVFSLLILFTGCDDENPKPETGSVLIIHEGGFNGNNATIGSYDPDLKSYNANAFMKGSSPFIGDVQQSVLQHENSLYSVLNGSNSVEIIGLENLNFIASVEDEMIDKPRAITISGTTGYLSNWGPYGENFSLTDSNILTIDLTTNTVSGTIDTENGVEDVEIVGNKLLVTRNYYGAYQNLTIINIDNNEVEKDIELPSGPQEIIVDRAGNPWVVCSGGFLVRIDEEQGTAVETIDLSGAILGEADIYSNEIYFLQENKVKKVNISSGEIISLFNTVDITTPYAFAVDPNNGEIYIGDGVDYSDGGLVYRYSANGELLDDFISGILPTQFIFN